MKSANNIIRHLNNSSMSLKKIAELSDIPYVSLKAMKARKTFSTKVIDKLAPVLGLEVSELVGDEAASDRIFLRKLRNSFNIIFK